MNSVLAASSYVLVHAPDMVLHNGTTQTTEKTVNPGSDYLKALPNHIRSYEQALSYAPNQTYIGSMSPAQLGERPQPWYPNPLEKAERFGKFGEIMPQDEFLLLLVACDVFDLAFLEKGFVEKTLPRFKEHPLMREDVVARVGEGLDMDSNRHNVENEHAEGLVHQNELVG